MESARNVAETGMTETIGWPSRPREPIESAPQIPDYQCLKVIGRGAFGTVWLAEETTAGLYRAVKILRLRRLNAPTTLPIGPGPATPSEGRAPHRLDDAAPSPGRSSLVDRELDGIHAYQVSAGDHPHLIRILKIGTCKVADDSAAGEGRPAGQLQTAVYYVMEIADHAGGAQPHHAMDYQPLSLATLLRQRGRLPGTEVLKSAGDLLSAIEHLHKAGLHHRDVKPSNVLFVNGVLKLADLGLTASDGSSEPVGTPGFLPPLAADADPAQRHGPPSDLYALGKVLYELTTGLPAARFPEWPGDLDPASDPLLPGLRGLINGLCHPVASSRLSGPAEVRKRLRALAAPPRRLPLSRRRTVVLAGLGLLAVLAAVGGAAWWAARTEATFRERSEAILRQQVDPMEERFARPPYDGSSDAEELVVNNQTYSLTRRHAPGVTKSVTRGTNATVEFFDLQTRLGETATWGEATEGTKPSLIVGGAYRIRNNKNPVSGDVMDPRGEWNQLYLAVGEGSEAHLTLLYHGQPGRLCEGHFAIWVPLADLSRLPSGEEKVSKPVYLSLDSRLVSLPSIGAFGSSSLPPAASPTSARAEEAQDGIISERADPSPGPAADWGVFKRSSVDIGDVSCKRSGACQPTSQPSL